MEPAMLRIGTSCRKLAPSVMALAFAAIIGLASTAPALAQEENGWRQRQRDHGNRHHYRQPDRYENRSYERPAYVYAPPPVYYAQPPAYYAPPVIDFVFPLHFHD